MSGIASTRQRIVNKAHWTHGYIEFQEWTVNSVNFEAFNSMWHNVRNTSENFAEIHLAKSYLSGIPGKTRKAQRIEVARATRPEERSTVARRLKS